MQSPGCRPPSWDAEFLMLKQVGNRHPGPAGWLVSPTWVLTVAWPRSSGKLGWGDWEGHEIYNKYVHATCLH